MNHFDEAITVLKNGKVHHQGPPNGFNKWYAFGLLSKEHIQVWDTHPSVSSLVFDNGKRRDEAAQNGEPVGAA